MSGNNRKYINIVGMDFGKLTIIKELPVLRSKSGRSQRWVIAECECGKIKKIRLDRLTGYETKSCGCLQLNAIRNTGKLNNKGYKNKSLYIRGSSKYKEWRDKCFERDNYTCQISGDKGGELVVHHLEPFRLLISDIDSYSELLFDINNGVTIKREIHNKFHSKYGNKYFTKQNFLDFKQKYNVKQ